MDDSSLLKSASIEGDIILYLNFGPKFKLKYKMIFF